MIRHPCRILIFGGLLVLTAAWATPSRDEWKTEVDARGSGPIKALKTAPSCSLRSMSYYKYTVGEDIPFYVRAHDDDPGGSVVLIEWDFGDGGGASGNPVVHAYDADGTYAVTVTVTDNEGDVGQCSETITVLPAQESDDHWNCNLRVHWGELYGSPTDAGCYFGVQPGATDGYDLIDSKKPGCHSWFDLCAWFEHPSWGEGPIMADWRAPLLEGTSKQWGIDPWPPILPPQDYWLVETLRNAAEGGCLDPCWGIFEYPVAASIYITWQFGVSEVPPAPLPPDDYTFVIKYKGGLAAKPTGCAEPGVEVPAMDTTWDMEATPYIVVPIWSYWTTIYRYPACDGTTEPMERAKFFFIVANPGPIPSCTATAYPFWEQEAPATFTFTAEAVGEAPLTFSWDFGDGGSDVGNPVSHTYVTIGTQTVTCTVTDVDGDTGTCTLTVEVAPAEYCLTLVGDCRHMVTLPGDIVDPDPWEVFDELRPPNKELDLLSGNLARYDPVRQGYVVYYHWAPTEFGPISPCKGYWLWLFEDETICYEAVPWTDARAVYLPTVGWYMVGSPHAADCYLDDTSWSRGAEGPYPFSEIMNVWVQDPLIPWSCVSNSYGRCGLLPIDDDHYLRAFQGYWLYAFAGQVTMEVPSP